MRIMKNLLWLLSLSFIFIATGRSATSYKFIKNQTTLIKNPLKLRDPFKRKIFKRAKKGKSFSRYGDGTGYTNLESIENIPLDSIKIVGVLLGRNRRAMAKIGKGATFILKEGMKIGENEAEIKAILPGGIVLVEKIRNVYDQDEYLETVLPVSGE